MWFNILKYYSLSKKQKNYLIIICILFIIFIYVVQFQSDINHSHGNLLMSDRVAREINCRAYSPSDQHKHLTAVILTRQMVPTVWNNFLSLFCSGINVYVMLDTPLKSINNNSILFKHRLLYVSNDVLDKYGVIQMNLHHVSLKYDAWSRTIAWLYTFEFDHIWLIEDDVEWLNVSDIIYLFNLYKTTNTDLIAEHFFTYKDRPNWEHWPDVESSLLPKQYWSSTYNQLCRLSKKLVKYHEYYMKLMLTNQTTTINRRYRFLEFIFATIALKENLTIQNYDDKTTAG
jgi:hypothetical protein